MKKLLPVFFASFALLVLFSGVAYAAEVCIDPVAGGGTPANFISGGNGLVPCGQSEGYRCRWRNASGNIVYQDITASSQSNATTQCQALTTTGYTFISAGLQLLCPCQLGHFFIMIARIFRFAVYFIALPLAGILVVIGGLLILLSGVYQKGYETGKTILWNTGIALAIIFGAYIIVNTVLRALGYVVAWNVF